MRRRAAAVAVGAAVALAATLAGCSVDVVDDDAPTPSTAPRDDDRTDAAPADGGASASGSASTPDADSAADGAAAGDGPDASALPGRAELRALTTSQITCDGGEAAVSRAGAGVEVTDDCGTLTVDGAAAVVVAGDVEHLVVTGAGAQVAVRSAATVSVLGSAVTVTWEEGTPAVSGDTPGSTYGAVPAG